MFTVIQVLYSHSCSSMGTQLNTYVLVMRSTCIFCLLGILWWGDAESKVCISVLNRHSRVFSKLCRTEELRAVSLTPGYLWWWQDFSCTTWIGTSEVGTCASWWLRSSAKNGIIELMKVSFQEKIVKLGRSAAWICIQNSCRKIQTDLMHHEVTWLPMG